MSVYAIAGFFLAPWLVERQAVKVVAEELDAELRVERVAINPFVLSMTIDGLELDDPESAPLARVRQIHVNFQTSSLFRWAWTFREFRLDAPELHLSRDQAGSLNLATLLDERRSTSASQEPAEESALPRVIFQDVAIIDGAVNWHDRVPPDPVKTRLGPLDVHVQGLNTLPEQPGSQEVVIRIAGAGKLTWSGSLQLNPLYSTGEAAISGSHFRLLSAYVRHQTGIDITDGDADVSFRYIVAAGDGDGITATVEDLDFELTDMQMRTFPAAAGRDAEPRRFLSVPRLAVADGTARWPEKRVAVGEFVTNGADLNLHRDETGTLNVFRNLPAPEPDGEADEPQSAAEVETDSSTAAASNTRAGPEKEWEFELERFQLRDSRVRLRDESVQPAAELAVDAVNLEILDITNQVGAEFPARLSLQASRGGSLSIDGSVTALPAPAADFVLKTQDLELAGIQPYVEPLANVNFDSGALDVEARVQSSPADALRLDGQFAIKDLLITETELGTRLGSWEQLAASNVLFSAADKTLEVSEVRLQRPYGDILITEQGRVNFGRVAKTSDPDGGRESTKEAGALGESESRKPGLPIDITVGRVVVVDGAADFADQSLPLPFSARISALDGDLSTISTASADPSRISLEGKVDDYGLLQVTGSVTPVAPVRNTDVRTQFENIAVPKLSAYSVPFAGRKIESGRLDLNLGYRVKDGQLVADNQIILRDFELGDKVEHPDAMSLPLGLAVALLKDRHGTIDVELPVTGNVNDPEFKIGGAVIKALGNLIVKIASSPFTLLGKLVGIEPGELEYVTFLPGRADLTPPQLQKAASLAEALSLRPQLLLELPPVQAPEVDARVLREARLEAAIEARLADAAVDEEDAMYTTQRRVALEALFREMAPIEDPEATLNALRARNTRTAESEAEAGGGEDSDSPEAYFDELVYMRELRAELVPLQPLEDMALATLARDRAANLKRAILAADSALQRRVMVTEPVQVELDEKGRVAMKVKLEAGEVLDDTTTSSSEAAAAPE